MMMASAGAATGGGGGTGPDGTTNYVEVTVASSQVASNQTDFPVYVDLSDLPAGFFSKVKSDGGDIRVTKADGTTQLPREVVAIDTGASTGELHFKADSLSSSSDTTFRIYYGNASATEPAVTSTYGRNAVWSDYEAVYHLQEDPSDAAPQIIDSTGNGHDGTSSGGMNSGDLIAAQIGKGLDFDGGDDYINLGSFQGGDSISAGYTLTAWGQAEASGNVQSIIGADITVGPRKRVFQFRLDPDGAPRFIRFDSGQDDVVNFAGTALNDAPAWHKITATFTNVSGSVLYVDGASDTTDADTTDNQDWLDNDVKISGRENTEDFFANGLDEIRIKTGSVSGDWESMEYTNQNSPGTFYSVGTEQAA